MKDDIGSACLVTVDGTDFRIQEPRPFSKKWFSHKIKKPALRYEVCVSIQRGDIVWINGPFPCGQWNDVTIFRSALKSVLKAGERLEADKGYAGDPAYVDTPEQPIEDGIRKKSIVRARHETANGRLKQWGCLSNVFRHDILKHQSVLYAVAVITQLETENGEPLFQVDYGK